MRRFGFGRAAVLALLALGGCVGPTTRTGHIHENIYRKYHGPPVTTYSMCSNLFCNQIYYVESHCLLTDASGHAVTSIDVNIHTRVCIVNKAGCPITLKSDEELFGSSHKAVTLDDGECSNMRVQLEAAGKDYVIEILCSCVDNGNSNPDVHVGHDEEGGGG
jgi:hypothetical protein